MSEIITINEELIRYTEEMLPIALKMEYFARKQQELYDTFNSYIGSAKEEIDTYKEPQMKQIQTLNQGYMCLANNLTTIIQDFLALDEKRSTEFNLAIVENTGDKVLGELFGNEGV